MPPGAGGDVCAVHAVGDQVPVLFGLLIEHCQVILEFRQPGHDPLPARGQQGEALPVGRGTFGRQPGELPHVPGRHPGTPQPHQRPQQPDVTRAVTAPSA
jgi:hypothetical protein